MFPPFEICMRCAAGLVATWLLASSLAHADPARVPATSTAGSLAKELEGHRWRILVISFARSMPYADNHIVPAGDDGSDAYITFENGEITGSLGCGQLAGQYSLSNDIVNISADLPKDDRKRCGSLFRERADSVISALRNSVHLERVGEDAFHLSDEQKTYFIRLELLSPGFDLSEFRRSFWQLLNLDGNPIPGPNAEVQFGDKYLRISSDGFVSEFTVRYSHKKSAFDGPMSTTRPGARELPPLFERFGQTWQRIASYSVNGDELAVLDYSGQQIMLLRRIRPTGLEYRYWHIAEYGTDGILNPTVGSSPSLLTFVRGEIQGNGGCPGFIGNYTLAGDSISVRAGTISLAGWCPQQAEIQNKLVIQAFNKASRVREDNSRFLLQDVQGNTNIVLVPYAQPTHH